MEPDAREGSRLGSQSSCSSDCAAATKIWRNSLGSWAVSRQLNARPAGSALWMRSASSPYAEFPAAMLLAGAGCVVANALLFITYRHSKKVMYQDTAFFLLSRFSLHPDWRPLT